MIEGYLYLAQLYPDRDPKLFKVGYSKNPGNRAIDHKCLAPKLCLLRTWRASPEQEQIVLEAASKAGLVYGGEVITGDLDQLVTFIEQILTKETLC